MTVARRATLAGVATLLAASTVGATAAPPAPVVAAAGPQAAIVGFASPVVVSLKGQSVKFVNGDSTSHTLTAIKTRKKKVRYHHKTYTIRVPLFDSGNVNPDGVGTVVGVEKLKPGTYQFLCTLHTSMKGQLTVRAAG